MVQRYSYSQKEKPECQTLANYNKFKTSQTFTPMFVLTHCKHDEQHLGTL